MGRPLKKIDKDEVFRLAKRGCTQAEIAGHFGVAQSMISRRFRSDFELGSAQSKTSIRSLQFKRAFKGSDAMLIHLGKVYLGQTDRIDLTSAGEQIAASVKIYVPDNGRNAMPQLESKNGHAERIDLPLE